MNIKDTLFVIPSDWHSGSTVALFPNRFWQFEHANHQPTPKQVEMWKHFELSVEAVREKRQGKRMIVVNLGDAIEGMHHGSPQVITQNTKEQCEIHQELMDYFLVHTGFTDGDKLFYVKGTEAHVNDDEESCACDLGAEETQDGRHVFNKLEMEMNGLEFWFSHHGPPKGKGPNAGNPLRGWLRNIHFDCIRDGIRIPDMVISGHTHQPDYNTFIHEWGDGDGDGYGVHIMHGLICPSLQMKTRFGYRVAPVQLNRIGIAFFEVTAAQDILRPRFKVLKNHEEKVRV